MSIEPPHNPKKLVGSKWTAVKVEEKRRHWEVIELRLATDEVLLHAAIDGHQMQLKWRGLRDRDAWQPGWNEEV